MANKKISELSTRTPSLSDLMLVGDPSSGYSYKCTITSLATIIETDIADGYVTLSTTQTISGAKTFSNNLTLTSVSNAGVDTDKFLVLNGSNVVNFRTGSEVLSDIGGQGALTLTTTGTSGAATLVGNTLNIPQYQAVLTNPVTGTGTTNYIPKFTGTSAIGNSIMYEGTFAIGIGTITPFGGSSNYTALDLRGTVGSIIALGNTSNSITGRFLELSATSSNAQIFSLNSAPLSFGTESLSRLSIDTSGNVTISVIANATTDTDKFLVSDSGVIKYRTGAEVLSDIGGQAALTNPITGTGVNNQAAFFTGTNTIAGSSVLVLDGSNIAIGQAAAAQKLSVNGDVSITTINNATTDTDKFLVSDGGVIKYRTGSEVLSDIGAAASTSISGTTNYIPKFTSSSAIGNSQIFDNGTNVGIGTTIPGNKLTVSNGSDVGYLDFNNQSFILGTSTGSGISLFSSSATGVMTFSTNSTLRMTLDASGNLGLGVTPSAWSSLWSAQQVGQAGALFAYKSGSNYTVLTNNSYTIGGAYQTGDAQYINTGFSTAYIQNNSGQHLWMTAPSGTAGNAITFTQAMTLNASGRLLVGTTTDNTYSRLQVSGSAWIGTTKGTYFTDGATYSSIVGLNQAVTAYNGLELRASGTDGQLFLATTGNVGIGTTSPAYNLDVSGRIRAYTASSGVSPRTDLGGTIIAEGSTRAGLYILTSGTAAGSYGSIWWGNGNTNTDGYIVVQNDTRAMAFGTADGERMRITSGGELLINTTSDAGDYKLQVNGNVYVNGTSPLFAGGALELTGNANSVKTFYINRYGVASGSQHRLRAENGYFEIASANSEPIVLTGANVGIGTTSPTRLFEVSATNPAVSIKSTSATGYSELYFGDNTADNGYLSYAHNGDYLAIGVNNAERMRITSGGELLIDATTNSATSDVGSKFVSNGRLYTVSSYDDNTQESLSMYSTTASAYRFYVGWGGTVYATNTTISAISDARFKENVRDLDSALNKLMLLKPRVFDWKEGKGKNIKNDKGFIAQEFEQIFPELVDKWKEQAPQGEEAYKSIRQDLIPYLVKAIQELKAEIEILKNK
jgi:hypothetical protein